MSALSMLAAPAAAHASAPTIAVGDFGSGRVGASVAALLGLAGAIVGALALARATGRIRTRFAAGIGRNGAFVALVAGTVGAALGLLVVVTAEGGLGTGNGLGGGIVALIVGVIAVVFGASALARFRRAAA
ncbi:hypothetical protein B4N89_42505 [Embleya scabrispora]|uniref:Uncharacterized protein n=1 Tax=Embleya scabrispora TaxID=159449 RepID=A0A1T3NKE3_9ACTN|nr:DUF6223 family protein [Embleya scabrispora]OPC77218.1 hypothetical protein B4N89_42505 [Embleya scabrispora]